MIRKLFVCCVLLFVSLPAMAEDAQVGSVIEIEGTASLVRAGDKDVIRLTSSSDNAVFLNDIIETGDDSKAHILLIDDTEITLGENASLRVDEYVFDPDHMTGNQGRFSVVRGAFLFVSGLLSKGDNADVEIETAYGSIGIRGTRLWGGVLDGDDEYGVLVEEGEVIVRTERGRVRVGAGQGTSMKNRTAIPSKAKDWPQEKVGRVLKTVSLKRQSVVQERIAMKKAQHAALRARHKEKTRQHRLQRESETGGERYQKRKVIEQKARDNKKDALGPEDISDDRRQQKIEKPEKIRERQEKRGYNPF